MNLKFGLRLQERRTTTRVSRSNRQYGPEIMFLIPELGLMGAEESNLKPNGCALSNLQLYLVPRLVFQKAGGTSPLTHGIFA